VAVLDIDAGAALAAASEIEALGCEALAFGCDVQQEGQLDAAVERVMAVWGRIDVWVNSAGVYSGGPLTAVPLADWDRTLGVNFTGTYLGCRVAAPIMRSQGCGRIVNISSMAGWTSQPGLVEYSASKAGVIGITRSVAMDLAPHGVTVNAVCPGNTLTDLVREAAATAADEESISAEAWLAKRAAGCALGRLAEPEEIAGPVAFLASDEARYFTGQAIRIDGGRAS
jgi:NAD(P)-dependent dehydrogenase (short-subunit alcohol dehydrogenase family)